MANKPIMNEKNQIESGLRADVMRKSMENKNLLNGIGKIYAGTGTEETILIDGEYVRIPITAAVNPLPKDSIYGFPVLVSDVGAGTPTYTDTGVNYRYIKDDMLGDNPRVFNKIIAHGVSLDDRLGHGDELVLGGPGLQTDGPVYINATNGIDNGHVRIGEYVFCGENGRTTNVNDLSDIRCHDINSRSITCKYVNNIDMEYVNYLINSFSTFGSHVVSCAKGSLSSSMGVGSNPEYVLGIDFSYRKLDDQPALEGAGRFPILRGAFIKSSLLYLPNPSKVFLKVLNYSGDTRFAWDIVHGIPKASSREDIELTLDQDYIIMPRIIKNGSSTELEIYVIGSDGDICYGSRSIMIPNQFMQGVYLCNPDCAIDIEEIHLSGTDFRHVGEKFSNIDFPYYSVAQSVGSFDNYNLNNSYQLLLRSGEYFCMEAINYDDDVVGPTSIIKVPFSVIHNHVRTPLSIISDTGITYMLTQTTDSSGYHNLKILVSSWGPTYNHIVINRIWLE